MEADFAKLGEFAVPFTRGLVKLRDAAQQGVDVTLPADEAQAIVKAFRLLKDGVPRAG